MKNTVLTTDWAPSIEAAVRSIATVLVAVYTAGLMVGELLHTTNEQLAKAWRCLLVGHQAAEAVVTAAAEVIEPAATAAVELVEQATGLPLTSHSVVELRTLARERLGSAARLEGRRIAQATRRQLIAALT